MNLAFLLSYAVSGLIYRVSGLIFLHLGSTHIYISTHPIFPAAAVLMSYCNFSSLIFSSLFMTTCYTSSNTLFRKRKELFDDREVRSSIDYQK